MASGAEVGAEERAPSASSPQSARGIRERIEEMAARGRAEVPTPRKPSVAAPEKRPRETPADFRRAGGGGQGANPRPTPHIATEDRKPKRAHFQVGIDNPAENPVRARGLEKGEWAFHLACVLNMGDPHSVPSWCGIAEFMVEATEEFMATPRPTYIDDSTLIPAEVDVEDCTRNLDVASAALGLVRSPREESDQAPARTRGVAILGIYFERPEEGFVLPAPPEKVEAVLKLSEPAVEGALKKSLNYKCAAELTGE